MDKQHLQAILSTAGATEGKDGYMELSEGKSVTLYAAANGVPLSVARVTAIRVDAALLFAKTAKGETFVLREADVFAGAVEGTSNVQRKAGFL